METFIWLVNKNSSDKMRISGQVAIPNPMLLIFSTLILVIIDVYRWKDSILIFSHSIHLSLTDIRIFFLILFSKQV